MNVAAILSVLSLIVSAVAIVALLDWGWSWLDRKHLREAIREAKGYLRGRVPPPAQPWDDHS